MSTSEDSFCPLLGSCLAATLRLSTHGTTFEPVSSSSDAISQAVLGILKPDGFPSDRRLKESKIKLRLASSKLWISEV